MIVFHKKFTSRGTASRKIQTTFRCPAGAAFASGPISTFALSLPISHHHVSRQPTSVARPRHCFLDDDQRRVSQRDLEDSHTSRLAFRNRAVAPCEAHELLLLQDSHPVREVTSEQPEDVSPSPETGPVRVRVLRGAEARRTRCGRGGSAKSRSSGY